MWLVFRVASVPLQLGLVLNNFIVGGSGLDMTSHYLSYINRVVGLLLDKGESKISL